MAQWDDPKYAFLTTPLGNLEFLVRDDGEPAPANQIKRLALPKLLQFLPSNNYLINGGFGFAQRQRPDLLTTIASGTYGPDRWRMHGENADVQYQRNNGTAETGITSRYFGLWKKITNFGKMVILQPIENANMAHLRGRAVIFQIKMKASAAKTIRLAILELQAAGSEDTLPAPLVAAFGANTVDPTWGTNVAVIGAAQSKSVTTAWQNFSVTATVPSNSKNLLCAIWTDSQFATLDTLSMAEGGLYESAIPTLWSPKAWQTELLLCQRYFWKTFAVDTGPATGVGLGTGEVMWAAPLAGVATERGPSIYFPVPLRSDTPVKTTYNPVSLNAVARDTIANADCSADFTTFNSRMFAPACTGAAGTAAGNYIRWHFTFDAEL